MKIYHIKNWQKIYENNRTRELKKLDWIPIPNSQDGEGYTLTMAEKDGPQLLGAWMVILQVASRCGERGTLLRDTKKPHNSDSIARLTRFPSNIIQRALDWFSSEEMQWIETEEVEGVTENPAQSRSEVRESDVNPAGGCLEGKGREGNEEKGIDAARKARPISIDEVLAYCQEIGIPDSQYLWDKWTGNGFKNSGKAMKDWRAVIRSWKQAGYLPSQKPGYQPTLLVTRDGAKPWQLEAMERIITPKAPFDSVHPKAWRSLYSQSQISITHFAHWFECKGYADHEKIAPFIHSK
jgi:hypothetical protein